MKSFKITSVLSLICVGLVLSVSAFAAEPEIKSQWAGKKVAFLGDSIIDERQLAGNNTFPHFLESILGITPYVYGISGNQMHQILPQAQRLEAQLGQDVDAIIVFIGTNDYNHAVPLGEWFTERRDSASISMSTRIVKRHRVRNMTNDTFRGRANIVMDFLKTHYPTTQIIFLTPIHRATFFGGNNIQPDEDFANALGLFLDSYVDAIKEMANVWAVPVIDLNAICGLYPVYDSNAGYFRNANADRLHPNTAGHKRMAYSIAYQLLGYPASFDAL